MEDLTIINRCGEFHNFPILGIMGGVTYNPCLALRQFGYARRDGLHDALVQGAFDYENDVQSYRPIFVRAWGMVNKVDRNTLWNKNSIPLEPYLKWVRARTQNLMMPYEAILPIIMEPITEGDAPYTILHPNMPTTL